MRGGEPVRERGVGQVVRTRPVTEDSARSGVIELIAETTGKSACLGTK